ncbi:hypothetical protein ACFC0S_15610 [Streptomyces sp. NPDC056084]|uniref:hypothetical protein n=1 Tax=unclassified Streptomyces TaxID=2593676 RepID=UPI0035DE0702
MPDDLHRLGVEIADLKRRLDQLTRSTRLGNSSIEDGAVTVYDATGSLRAIIGQQPDGTTGAVPVNGPPPPAPSAPQVTPAIAALAITWDGAWSDAAAAVGDLARVQVHLLATPQAAPDLRSPAATIEAQTGATVTVPCTSYDPVWVCLVAINTSGAPGPASAPVQGTPRRLVATDVYEGTLTAKEIKANSLTADRMDINDVRAGLLVAGSIKANMLDADALNGKVITGGHIIGVQIDGSVLRTGDAGSRVEITQVPATDTQPSTGQVRLLSGAATETAPAALYAAYDSATNTSKMRLQSAELRAPTPPAGGALPRLGGPMSYPGASLSMWSEPDKGRMELSATEVSSSAESTLFGATLYDRIEIRSGGSINARDHNDQPTAVFFHHRFYVGTDGSIGLYNQTWKTPSLGVNWAQYGGNFDKVAYRVYPDNTVGLRGILKRTVRSTPANGEELFTLPPEALPANTSVQQWTLVVLPTGALGTASAMISVNLSPATGRVTLSNISSAASTQLASGNGYVTWNVRYPID